MPNKDPYFAIRALFKSSQNQFFSVTFVKRDGTLRTLKSVQIQAGVSHINGGSPGVTEKRALQNPHIVNLWDQSIPAFRAVDMRNIVEIQLRGLTYRINRDLEPYVYQGEQK